MDPPVLISESWYEALGGGGYANNLLPTQAQEVEILNTWGPLLLNPAFDYAYSWDGQLGDTALSNDPAPQAVFLAHNTGAVTSRRG
jgi:hypothetical protein